MTSRRRLLSWVLIAAVAFAAGFGSATLLSRLVVSSGVRGQTDLYGQILQDLQRDYYRPVDVSRLGQTGIAALLKSLHDPYTVYFTPQQAKLFNDQLAGTYSGVGAAITKKGDHLTVTQVFSGSPAAEAGVRPGDVIVAVNGNPTAKEPADVAAARIQGPAGTTVRLQIQRPGGSGLIDLSLTRREVTYPLVSSRLLNDHGIKVGYIGLSSFAQGAGREVGQAAARLQARGASWLILDLRDNGGGLVSEAVKAAGDFLPAGAVVATTQGLHSPKDVLRTGEGSPSRLPLVVLVNGNTASAAEILTGALKDHGRATVIGTRTFGKGVVQDVLPLVGGAALKITVASYRTPNGADINHKGIEPSIVAAQPAHSPKDKVLQRALRFIRTGH
jgi:carboxyl-terminal processing protease